MARPCKCRYVQQPHGVTAFKPAGISDRCLQTVQLGLDELEALRLGDLQGLYHEDAAQQMGISRATFGRLIERARHKVACALTQSKMLVFKGGPVMPQPMHVFECADCGATCEVPHGTDRPETCPACQCRNIHRVKNEPITDAGHGACHRGRHGQRRRRCRRSGEGNAATQTESESSTDVNENAENAE